MAKQDPPAKNLKILDVYDEEFIMNLELARNLMARLIDPKEIEICKKWLIKLCSLKANDVTVKRNRNCFFKYFLQVLDIQVQSVRDQYPPPEKELNKDDPRDFMCRWSPDKRTYIAAKPLPGEGTLVYLAVSRDPSLGWEKNGVATFV